MKCPKHKTYKAKRRPTSNCLYCWHEWLDKNMLYISVEKLMETRLKMPDKSNLWAFESIIPTLIECLNANRSNTRRY